MTFAEFYDFCKGLEGSNESFPFDEKTLVFKRHKKIFALADSVDFSFINLKCDPENAVELREHYQGIQPGYHMNKKHWNTVNFEGSLRNNILKELIDHSYDCVVKGLTKKLKTELSSLSEKE